MTILILSLGVIEIYNTKKAWKDYLFNFFAEDVPNNYLILRFLYAL